jgi:NAD(P)-dependent dehydrogenase (short-subunit alcohol dehydrogenase family)
LITGAGSGIGRGAALALAAEGASIVATDVDDKGAAETAALIAKAGGKAVTLHHDVTSESRWAEVVAEIKKTQGALHILVNNAGIGIAANIFEMSHADWQRQMAINVDGVFFGVKHAIPLIAASGGGSVINISSVAGLQGAPGLAGYCATKGAVRLFTKAVALECAQAKMNVRVNSVHPGIIDTAIWQKIPQGGMGSLRLNATQPGANAIDPNVIAASTPLGYAGLPSDIAAGIVFLASDESRYMTGSELVIDGGITAS